MLDKVGDEYQGTISAVTSFGLFIELDEIFVEGLAHVTALQNDYYHYDSVGHRLTGERTGMAYRLGDRVRVQVTRVDLDPRKIDFDVRAKLEKGRGAGADQADKHPARLRSRNNAEKTSKTTVTQPQRADGENNRKSRPKRARIRRRKSS